MEGEESMKPSCERRLAILKDFGRLVAKTKEIDTLLQKMADFARDLLEADRCSIFIHDEKHHTLWTRVAHEIDRIEIPDNKGVVGYATLSKEIQIVIDAYNDFRFNPDIDKITGYVTHTILAVPLLDHDDKVLGVFQALNKKGGPFTYEDAELLIFISNYTAAAIENMLLQSRLHNNQLKLINKLSTAAEFKDTETSNHTKRVGEYAAAIASVYGLPEEKISSLRYTAPMHDVGKIGIGDAILRKPGPLTDEEFEIMKTHTIIGHNLLRDDDNIFLEEAARIALEHHEKYDGSGYPNGKKGNEISIEGRIVAIADVFDALTSERPYKRAWSPDEAFEWIAGQSGSHFDPLLVEIFLSIRKKIEAIRAAFQD
jgi:HD-GYP domain-containing protein (c-di-GMP phosphodiesterase class II)